MRLGTSFERIGCRSVDKSLLIHAGNVSEQGHYCHVFLQRGELSSEGLNELITQPSIFFDGCFFICLNIYYR